MSPTWVSWSERSDADGNRMVNIAGAYFPVVIAIQICEQLQNLLTSNWPHLLSRESSEATK